MRLYVGNLNYKVKENDLVELFAVYGEAKSVKIITDRLSGKSKGYAFLELNNDAEAAKAIADLNEREFMGRNLVISEAKGEQRGKKA